MDIPTISSVSKNHGNHPFFQNGRNQEFKVVFMWRFRPPLSLVVLKCGVF